MVIKWHKGESYPDAVKRVLENNILDSIDDDLNFEDFKKAIAKGFESKAKGLIEFLPNNITEKPIENETEEEAKERMKREKAANKNVEEMYAKYRNNPEEVKKEMQKHEEEVQRQMEEQAKKDTQEKLRIKVTPVSAKPRFQQFGSKLREIKMGKPILIKQKSAKGKEYVRGHSPWEIHEIRWLDARKDNNSNIELTKMHNAQFPNYQKTVKAISTKKSRLRRKSK